jgi:hypothetical protein
MQEVPATAIIPGAAAAETASAALQQIAAITTSTVPENQQPVVVPEIDLSGEDSIVNEDRPVVTQTGALDGPVMTEEVVNTTVPATASETYHVGRFDPKSVAYLSFSTPQTAQPKESFTKYRRYGF